MAPDDLQIANRIAGTLDLGDAIGAVEFIDLGFSTDRKFRIETNSGAQYLLRLSPIGEEAGRRFEFESVANLHAKGVRCQRAIRFGTEEGVCYGLYSYIPGECAADALPRMTLAEQYGVGLQAGQQLRAIHGAMEPPAAVDEFAVRGGKYRKYAAMLAESGVTFAGQKEAATYAEENMRLLQGRPTTFRHGDFHPSNLIVEGAELAGVIDFNRCDWGDPFDDFYKTALFGAPLSPSYARGLMRGYFDGDPPEGFWPLYNLYTAAILPADIVWSQQLFPHRVSESIERVERITRSHDFQSGGAPDWWANADSCCAPDPLMEDAK